MSEGFGSGNWGSDDESDKKRASKGFELFLFVLTFTPFKPESLIGTEHDLQNMLRQ